MQQNAEYNTDSADQYCKRYHFKENNCCHRRNFPYRKRLRQNVKEVCYEMGNHCRRHAGNQCGIVHNSYTDNLHRENGCSHGRAEKGRKAGTHTTHDNNALVILI